MDSELWELFRILRPDYLGGSDSTDRAVKLLSAPGSRQPVWQKSNELEIDRHVIWSEGINAGFSGVG